MQSINCKINQLFFIACFGFMFLQPQSHLLNAAVLTTAGELMH